jgi:hypothetical protein
MRLRNPFHKNELPFRVTNVYFSPGYMAYFDVYTNFPKMKLTATVRQGDIVVTKTLVSKPQGSNKGGYVGFGWMPHEFAFGDGVVHVTVRATRKKFEADYPTVG